MPQPTLPASHAVRMPFRVAAGMLAPLMLGAGVVLAVVGARERELTMAALGPGELAFAALFAYVARYGHPPDRVFASWWRWPKSASRPSA